MRTSPRTISESDWRSEGEALFGNNEMQWRFVCPACGHVASVQDWKDSGAPVSTVAFSCVGRWQGADQSFNNTTKPCNYAGGGLIRLNPVTVIRIDGKESKLFEFEKRRES